jgi:HK97 family phage major capsid protein
MCITWQGTHDGLARFHPDMYGIARAMTGQAGGSSGGFLIPPQWSNWIADKAREFGGPFSMCIQQYTNRREYFLPVYFETSRAEGARLGGIRSYWRGAGSSETEDMSTMASQPSLGMIEFLMKRLFVFWGPISRALESDTALVKPTIGEAVAKEFRVALETAMLVGNGLNAPYGITISPATVTVPKDVGQAPGTISQNNIDLMDSALYGPCRRNATWHCSDETLLAISKAANSASPAWPAAVYLPQGVNGNERPLIKGRPLICMEGMPPVGTPGDLVAVDWSQYCVCFHIGANQKLSSWEVSVGLPGFVVDATRSEDVAFDQDAAFYKFKMRADGKLIWPKPLLNANGAQVGPAVMIAQR